MTVTEKEDLDDKKERTKQNKALGRLRIELPASDVKQVTLSFGVLFCSGKDWHQTHLSTHTLTYTGVLTSKRA